jgi:hypothetical protein
MRKWSESLRNGKEVNTMMDMSSVIDASLAIGGAIAVVLIGISTLASESTTVSMSFEETGRQSDATYYPPFQAAA